MALTERTEVDQVEIVGPYRMLQVRTATVIERDGVEVAREHHRKVLAPDADVAAEVALVKDVAGVAWTQEVKDAWTSRDA